MESEDSGRREVINNAVTWVIVILVAAIRLTLGANRPSPGQDRPTPERGANRVTEGDGNVPLDLLGGPPSLTHMYHLHLRVGRTRRVATRSRPKDKEKAHS